MIFAAGRTLSAGMASAASLATLNPGSSAHAPAASLSVDKAHHLHQFIGITYQTNRRLTPSKLFILRMVAFNN
ncbi:hypothetical protein [Psychrobacillus sp. OK032]|uniref:hypothetical protein n=1 Tax=Psychrobacillus sp. OK032 TaxID=1884358 RepID=UPI000B818327|nr:hypothetical protein [Psychrobacillus sp. OK032]